MFFCRFGNRKADADSVLVDICAVCEGHFFGRPHQELPEEYTQKDIFIRRNLLTPFDQYLLQGDVLEVRLGYKNPQKPEAIKASIVEITTSRNTEQVLEFFMDMNFAIQPMSSNALNTEKLVSYLKSTAIWEFFYGTKEPPSHFYQIFLQKIVVANNVATYGNMSKHHVRRFFQTLLDSYQFFGVGTPNEAELNYLLPILLIFFQNVTEFQPEKTSILIPMLDKFAREEYDKHWIKCIKNVIRGSEDYSSDFRVLEWDQLPNIPTSQELFGQLSSEDRRLQPVLTSEPYNSVSHYLDTYFRLLRENCFAALKTGISELLENKLDFRDMIVYKRVHFKGITLSENGIILVMSLDENSLRPGQTIRNGDLQYGNLVCLSASGSFQDSVWATVFMREKEPKPAASSSSSQGSQSRQGTLGFALELSKASNEASMEQVLQQLDCASGHLSLVESPTYFKAHEPVLANLQLMDKESLAFEPQLVSLVPSNVPKYLQTQNATFNNDIIYPNLPTSYDALMFTSHLKSNKSEVIDDSQRLALRCMLKNEIAIVQGPPGCGKTYLGAKFVNLIMTMQPKLRGPVLLLTYKNHALDEFLKRVLSFLPSEEICRIGGRSEAPELEATNLRSMRGVAFEQGKVPSALKAERFETNQKLDEAKRQLCYALEINSKKYSLTTLDFASKFLSEAQIWKFLSTIKNIPVNKLMVFKTITTGKAVTSSEIMKICKSAIDECRMFGLPNSDLKAALALGPNCLDAVDDFLLILDHSLRQWLPNEKFVKEVEQEFVVEIEKPTKNLRQAQQSTDDDDIDDLDLEMDRFKVLADSKSSGFKDFKQLSNEAVRLRASQNNPNYPLALQLQSFASDLCEKSPSTILSDRENISEMPLRVRLIAIQSAILASLNKDPDSDGSDDDVSVPGALEKFKKFCDAKSELDARLSYSVMSHCRVIGMTITGASINRHLIDLLRPSVVVVEEAAEVLEPQLTALLKPYVQHLVMIGDHKQLRPSVESFELIKDYNFDISMMERLILGKMPYALLQFQNRMRPGISAYLTDIYPDLKDGPNVVAIRKVKFTPKSIFFWTHDCIEKAERSYTNIEEAKRCSQLANFLVGQGFKPSEITIIAAYKGQKGLIRKELEQLQKGQKSCFPEKMDRSENVQIQTIDMYQGDENEVVIISLTRSNNSGKVGFMKELNRRCVAQSRAKRLCIFIGNDKMFNDQPKWKVFMSKLRLNDSLDSVFTIQCPREEHRLITTIQIKDSEVFPPQSFCQKTCGMLMPSCRKHLCPMLCQPDHSHDICKHPIKYNDLMRCLHERNRKCFQDPKDIVCGKPCLIKFTRCDHACDQKCEPKHEHLLCRKRVPTFCRDCSGPMQKYCHQEFSQDKCKSDVQIICAKCKKPGTKRCSDPIASYNCLENCIVILPFCGHACDKLCWQACPDKKENCSKCKEIIRIENERRNAQLKKQHEDLAKRFRKELEDAKTGNSAVTTFSRETLSPNGETSAEYMKVEDMVLKSVQKTHNWFPMIQKIEKIKNSELSAKFHEAVMKMFDSSYIDQKFHGTDMDAVEKIIKNGFKPSSKGMYGPGVYLATDSSKSAQEKYTKQSNMLLVCKVGLGKTKKCDKAWDDANGAKLKKEGFDSIFAPRGTKDTGGVLFDEFVVFDPDRVLPEYIVHYNKRGVPVMSGFNYALSGMSSMGPGGYQKIELKHKRGIDNAETQNYLMAAAQFYSLIQNPQFSNRKLAAIYYHQNPALEAKFAAECALMKAKYPNQEEGEPILAFHGTPTDANLDNIARNNFDLRKLRSCAYGWGVYLSELPDISLSYARGAPKLLLCKVLPGKSRLGDCGRSIGPDNLCFCDSHKIAPNANGRGSEIVINNVNRILPCFELHLQ